jgi:hypothetical protein
MLLAEEQIVVFEVIGDELWLMYLHSEENG